MCKLTSHLLRKKSKLIRLGSKSYTYLISHATHIVSCFSIAGSDAVHIGDTMSLPSGSVTQVDMQEQLVTKEIAGHVLTERNQTSHDSSK